MNLERFEVDNLHREKQDFEQTLRWEAFRPDAIYQITECLQKDGDLMDLINDLDLNYDEYDSLTNAEINSLVTEAVKLVIAEKDAA